MRDIISTLWTQITAMNIQQWMITFANQYFPFGLFWWMIGIVIFMVFHIKTKDLAYSSIFLALYFVALPETGLITNVFSLSAMRYAGIIIGAVAGYYLYKAWKG